MGGPWWTGVVWWDGAGDISECIDWGETKGVGCLLDWGFCMPVGGQAGPADDDAGLTLGMPTPGMGLCIAVGLILLPPGPTWLLGVITPLNWLLNCWGTWFPKLPPP